MRRGVLLTTIEMEGGRRLNGEIAVQGSKNAVLPMMAASLLCTGVTVIHNCPMIDDVKCMMELLRKLGCVVEWEGHTLTIDSTDVNQSTLDEEMVREVRASVLFLGSLLARMGNARICYPGGCSIGKRPIDYHLQAFEKMGANIQIEEEHLICKVTKFTGKKIVFDFPSVGATENVILVAVLADGITRIDNAAREPEIVELCRYLQKMGAIISGEGTKSIIVQGVDKLYPVEYTVSYDRIVLATYGLLIAGTGGSIVLKTNETKELTDVQIFSRVGCKVKNYKGSVLVKQQKRPHSIDYIKTRPYPGFPTDVQSLLLSVLVKAKGDSILEENIFENRFRTVSHLKKMGADVEVKGSRAYIHGVKTLKGNNVFAPDLRGGAALVLAGLMAEKHTRLGDANLIARGYEDIVGHLQKVGAKITQI